MASFNGVTPCAPNFREVDLSCESMNRLDLMSCFFFGGGVERQKQKNTLYPRVLSINWCFLVHRVDIAGFHTCQIPRFLLGPTRSNYQLFCVPDSKPSVVKHSEVDTLW